MSNPCDVDELIALLNVASPAAGVSRLRSRHPAPSSDSSDRLENNRQLQAQRLQLQLQLPPPPPPRTRMPQTTTKTTTTTRLYDARGQAHADARVLLMNADKRDYQARHGEETRDGDGDGCDGGHDRCSEEEEEEEDDDDDEEDEMEEARCSRLAARSPESCGDSDSDSEAGASSSCSTSSYESSPSTRALRSSSHSSPLPQSSSSPSSPSSSPPSSSSSSSFFSSSSSSLPRAGGGGALPPPRRAASLPRSSSAHVRRRKASAGGKSGLLGTSSAIAMIPRALDDLRARRDGSGDDDDNDDDDEKEKEEMAPPPPPPPSSYPHGSFVAPPPAISRSVVVGVSASRLSAIAEAGGTAGDSDSESDVDVDARSVPSTCSLLSSCDTDENPNDPFFKSRAASRDGRSARRGRSKSVPLRPPGRPLPRVALLPSMSPSRCLMMGVNPRRRPPPPSSSRPSFFRPPLQPHVPSSVVTNFDNADPDNVRLRGRAYAKSRKALEAVKNRLQVQLKDGLKELRLIELLGEGGAGSGSDDDDEDDCADGRRQRPPPPPPRKTTVSTDAAIAKARAENEKLTVSIEGAKLDVEDLERIVKAASKEREELTESLGLLLNGARGDGEKGGVRHLDKAVKAMKEELSNGMREAADRKRMEGRGQMLKKKLVRHKRMLGIEEDNFDCRHAVSKARHANDPRAMANKAERLRDVDVVARENLAKTRDELRDEKTKRLAEKRDLAATVRALRREIDDLGGHYVVERAESATLAATATPAANKAGIRGDVSPGRSISTPTLSSATAPSNRRQPAAARHLAASKARPPPRLTSAGESPNPSLFAAAAAPSPAPPSSSQPPGAARNNHLGAAAPRPRVVRIGDSDGESDDDFVVARALLKNNQHVGAEFRLFQKQLKAERGNGGAAPAAAARGVNNNAAPAATTTTTTPAHKSPDRAKDLRIVSPTSPVRGGASPLRPMMALKQLHGDQVKTETLNDKMKRLGIVTLDDSF